jgi:acyl carrier protein
LGEIESHLLAHPQVAEAVVLAVGEGSEKYLAAYIVPKDIAANATASATAVLPFDEAKLIADLKRELMANLPLYMVPQAFACMASLPLNTNSKLDRNMLSKNFLVQQNMVQFVAPRTETEEVLLAIWQEMLGREEISVTANFFEIGGQSLVAIRIGNEIARRFALEIETRYLFEYVTIEALAAYIEVMQEQTKQVLDSSSSTTSANDADEDVEIEF